MHTGTAHQETLSQVLRGISQRRRNGILDVRLVDGSVRLHFYQGKVVEFSDPRSAPCAEVFQLLVEAGIAPVALDWIPQSYAALRSALIKDSRTDALFTDELFRRAILHRVLSKLYALNLEAPALTGFDSSMVEYEREFAPAISVGQLLLDLVALESDRPKFLQLFSGSILLSQGQGESAGLSSDEILIHSMLKVEKSLPQLRKECLLSEYAFQDALVRLHDQALIAIRQVPASSGKEDFLDQKLLDGLDASIDEVFEAEGISSSSAALSDPPSQVLPLSPEGSPDVSDAGAAVIASETALLPIGFRQRLALASSRAMHMHWIPALVMMIFLLSAVLVPLFLWQHVYEAFAG